MELLNDNIHIARICLFFFFFKFFFPEWYENSMKTVFLFIYSNFWHQKFVKSSDAADIAVLKRDFVHLLTSTLTRYVHVEEWN